MFFVMIQVLDNRTVVKNKMLKFKINRKGFYIFGNKIDIEGGELTEDKLEKN